MNKKKKAGIIRRIWTWFRTPSRLAIGTLLILGFIAGIVFLNGFHATMEVMNSEKFCTSCHEMRDNVYQEYMDTVHYSNRTGVRAICSDCHVPKEFVPKMIRKIQASKELYGKVTGVIDTPQKFDDHRLAMAKNEWARMKANNSQECRNCHNFDFMDFTEQKTVASKMHAMAIKENKTCIDCHKGIAHKLPDMTGIPNGF
ncbi:MAG: cytochrome c-type protein NapC [Enterobacteriaceae bacterium]|nr:cytochrome c-type protein NapC [Enterobacteriaceae bacterium]